MTTRRNLLAGSAALLAAPALAPAGVRAQGWPARPISMLVGFAPGGGTDIIARLLQPALQQDLGQPIAVENRPGASGTLAAAAITRAQPDGHTVLMTTVSASAVVPPQMKPPPFDIHKDQLPVVLAATVPLVAVVPADSPVQSLRQLLERARKEPGALNYSSSGVMTQQHLAAELLGRAAGVEMTHIPFRGTGQAVNEVMAGRIDIAIDTFPTYYPHIRSGRVRALAVTMPERVEWLPDVPTVAELGFPGFDANVWYMLMAPPGTPAPIVERLAGTVNRALQDPALRQRVRDSGFIPGGGSPADAAALLRHDAERYARLIGEAGIRFE